MGWLRLLGLAAALVGAIACGDDSGKSPEMEAGAPEPDASGGDRKDAGKQDTGTEPPMDSGTKVEDAGDTNPFGPIDSGPAPDVVYKDPVFEKPAEWACPDAFWNDGICDCGCSARDEADCTTFSCIEPGCRENTCDACFTADLRWQSCSVDASAEWKCAAFEMSDAQCDCGCGLPDPACFGSGCTSGGCYVNTCDDRHDPVWVLTDGGGHWEAPSLGSGIPTDVLTKLKCAKDSWGGGDGCDCGCGVADPDCGGEGCTGGRCFDASCDRCHDENGRPYPCEAAEAGWDEEISFPGANIPSMCNAALHFGTGDGCDCGCGGFDPDCGTEGCAALECQQAACDRCTVGASNVTGCAVPSTWSVTYQCPAENYGTGDGCDCGCGEPDPDCAGAGSTNPDATPDASCDVCHDGAGGVVPCPGWTCTDENAFAPGDRLCDCGCGVVDPECRQRRRVSCTAPGCTEYGACDYCNDATGARVPCGEEWRTSTATGSECTMVLYGDGICDCGCGFPDIDCGSGEGCTERGCRAPGCEVCHQGSLSVTCFEWTCDRAAYGSGDGCDCGCGAPDPDCDTGGCRQVGCENDACDTYHDAHGRVLP
ncbi:MAG: hypothetical protein OEZ06_06355 [Myxococcales bacterium]|nr:hypothetical protein [Myxococcales bacterium]